MVGNLLQLHFYKYYFHGTGCRYITLQFMRAYRAAVCDVTGDVASLNFDATELQIFYGNLGSPSNPNLQYGDFETYH